MWFEIAIGIVAGFLLCSRQQQGIVRETEKKGRLAVWVAAPVWFLMLYQRTFSVQELLVMMSGYLLARSCGYALHKAGKMLQIRLRLPVWQRLRPIRIMGLGFIWKAVAVLLLYIFVVSRYLPGAADDGIRKEGAALLFAVVSACLFFSDRIYARAEQEGWRIPEAVLAAAVPVLGFFLVEHPYNMNLQDMRLRFATGNILWLAALFFVVYFLVPYKRAAAGMFLTVCLGFGVGNYYVGQFRGNPVMPGDLLSAGTAVQVAGGYVFEITNQVLTGVLSWYAGLAVLCCLPVKTAGKNQLAKAVAAGLTVCVSMHHLGTVNVETAYGWQLDQWDVASSYQSVGSVFGFAALLEKMSVSAPEGYHTRKAEACLEQYQTTQNTPSRQPAIIVIMDETFSDLRTLGAFACSEEYLQNWYAMDDYAYRGKLYVSVFGGCTANSEYEFLTGNSMGNHPPGIVPYQNYNLSHVGNLADLLQARGYQTTAVHPQQKNNWNRTRTYAGFGFDTFLGLGDFENPQYLRGHVSDQSAFDKIIELYEEGTGKPQFIFNVTMQNHGGYLIDELSGMRTVKLAQPWAGYPDVETYLTLIRESDQAIQRLTDYFRQVEEPVVLCIFGDHLPNLDSAWIEHVMGKPDKDLSLEEVEKKYAVPYMIWTNFETDDRCRELDTSANYLGVLLLEQAGIRPSAYMEFLLHMQEEIPVINATGYQTKDGKWHTYDAQTEVTDWLERYRMLQYYAVFDPDQKIRYFRSEE